MTNDEKNKDIFVTFGEVPEAGEWNDYYSSLRIMINRSKKHLIHYHDGKPKVKGTAPLRRYTQIDKKDISAHIQTEIIAWSILSEKPVADLVKALEVSLT